jgi:hypothetical protein
VFDYTANSIERRQGFVVLGGHRVESVGYAPDTVVERRRPESAFIRPPPPAATPFSEPVQKTIQKPPQSSAEGEGEDEAQGDDSNKRHSDSRVLRLDDWRARKRSGDRQN